MADLSTAEPVWNSRTPLDGDGSCSYCDLHVHSSASDGTLSPAEIVALAAERRLRAIALTDHDTIDGVPEFLAAAQAYPGLRAIPGVELSTRYGARELHILGLFVDPGHVGLNAFLSARREERQARAEVMQRKLASLGYEVSEADLRDAGATDTVGRPHFARAIAKKYHFSSISEVFDKLLKRGAPGYVMRTLPDPATAMEVIHQAGGVASWAHPIFGRSSERSFARRIIERFAPLGLDAIEAYYSEFPDELTEYLLELATRKGLAVSGGTDFHGANHPGIALGCGRGNLRVPMEILSGLEKKKEPKLVLL